MLCIVFLRLEVIFEAFMMTFSVIKLNLWVNVKTNQIAIYFYLLWAWDFSLFPNSGQITLSVVVIFLTLSKSQL